MNKYVNFSPEAAKAAGLETYTVKIARSVVQVARIDIQAHGTSTAEGSAMVFAQKDDDIVWENEGPVEYHVQWSDKADRRKALTEDVKEFWRRSEKVLAFQEEQCSGSNPAGSVLRGDGTIVLTNGDRSSFALLGVKDGWFAVEALSDGLLLADAEAERTQVLKTDDIDAAWKAAMEHLGYEVDPAPAP